MFLFTVIFTSLNRASASFPVRPKSRTSNNNKWLSVPPDTKRIPPSVSASPNALAFLHTWSMYCLYSSDNASLKATALPAIICSNGPPCNPGNTDLSISFACSSLQRIAPPLGPRRVL